MPYKRSLPEVLQEHFQSAIEGIHVSIPGIVQKYNSTDQTCDVLPAVKRPVRISDGTIGYESHPVIPNVKVAFPKSGAFGIHWNLVQGDGVWLVFSELSTAEYIETNKESEPFDVANMGLGSPIALPCSCADAANFQTLKDGNRIGIDNDHAQIDFQTGGKILIGDDATLAAARETDTTTAPMTQHGAYTAIAAALVCTTPGNPPTVNPAALEYDLAGSINSGSSTVKIRG